MDIKKVMEGLTHKRAAHIAVVNLNSLPPTIENVKSSKPDGVSLGRWLAMIKSMKKIIESEKDEKNC